MSNLIPTLGLFGAAAFKLVPSIIRIMSNLQKLKYNFPVILTLSEEINSSKRELNIIGKNILDTNETKKSINFSKKIRIKNLDFQYPESEKRILNNISLNINYGSVIGIVGQSGVGKTTLINLVLGLIKPISGDILVDDKSIFKNLRGWQNEIGYVPQNIFLFDDTIKKNIAFELTENKIDNQKIIKSIQDSQLEKLINEAPQGIDTKIGEFGDRLSGGQKQRVGIARALYTNPKVLIMDESTNSLDVTTEKKIVEELFQLRGKITIIIIAHRTTIFEKCDKIFRLNSNHQKKIIQSQLKEVEIPQSVL
jgi:ABC-type bacteriocin/lantibiotic exporter with double-glycine peptidase domain